MKLHRFTPLLVTAGIGLVGCSDTLIQPEERDVQRASFSTAASAASAAGRNHLVVFDGAAPADFATKVAALGATVLVNHHTGIAIVAGLNGETAGQLRTAVNAKFVEEEPEFQLIEPAGVTEPTMAAFNALLEGAPEGITSAADPTTAILFSRQWNMRQVNAPAAWAAGRLGDENVTVAILDTGIDYLLPDLVGRVDLSRSVSFVAQDDAFAAQFFPGRHPSTDLHYHGTNVATQVASNAWAFAGVTSRTTLMSVKVCGVIGGCPSVAQGILYAIDNGADVINMSLGGWFSRAAFPGAVAAYNTLMNYASQRGVTIVVAAGNDANDLDRQNNIAIKDATGAIIDRRHIPSFFAAYCDATHVICVSSTRTNDIPSSFTNYGLSAIDVAAPGGGSGDWVYALCPQTSLVFNCAGGFFVLGVAGTSQATPHVAGLAALAVQDVGRNPARVAAYVRNSADAIGSGASPYYGRGRINVGRAVGAM